MKQYQGGQWAKGGTYWDFRTGEFIAVPEKGGELPAGGEKRYIRAPLGLVIAAGPFMGLLYVMFLPLLGIAGLTIFLAQRAARRVNTMWQPAARAIALMWPLKVAIRRGKKTHQK